MIVYNVNVGNLQKATNLKRLIGDRVLAVNQFPPLHIIPDAKIVFNHGFYVQIKLGIKVMTEGKPVEIRYDLLGEDAEIFVTSDPYERMLIGKHVPIVDFLQQYGDVAKSSLG